MIRLHREPAVGAAPIDTDHRAVRPYRRARSHSHLPCAPFFDQHPKGTHQP